MLVNTIYVMEEDVMGYPMTTFELYADGEFKGAINLVGNALDQWEDIVGVIVEYFPEITHVNIFKMNGEFFMGVELSPEN